MVTKAQFLSRPKIRALPPAERERRWLQHVGSVAGPRPPLRAGPVPLAQRGAPRPPPRQQRQNNNAGYTACGKLYAMSLANPFDTDAVCLPGQFSQSSQKTKIFIRGAGVIGVGGVGWVLFRPTPSNGVDSAAVTGAGYLGTTATNLSSAAAGVTLIQNNGPFATASWGPDADEIQSRVVSAGIRARYTGTQQDLAGSMLCFEEPSHQTMNQVDFSWNSIRSHDRARTVPTTREWVSVTSQPISSVEMNDYNIAPTDGSTNKYYMVIMMTGTPGQGFDYDVTLNVEFIGALARSKTRNDEEPKLGAITSRMAQASTLFFDKATRLVGPALWAEVSKALANPAPLLRLML